MKPDPSPEIYKRFQKVFANVQRESTRGKVLILCAYIDNLLRDLINKHLKPKREDAYWPRQEFALRIEFAYRLGLIHKEDATALDLLRDIRNKCAHDLDHFSLDEAKYGNQLVKFLDQALKRIHEKPSRAEFLATIFPQTTEEYLTWLCVIYVVELEFLLARTNQIRNKF